MKTLILFFLLAMLAASCSDQKVTSPTTVIAPRPGDVKVCDGKGGYRWEKPQPHGNGHWKLVADSLRVDLEEMTAARNFYRYMTYCYTEWFQTHPVVPHELPECHGNI